MRQIQSLLLGVSAFSGEELAARNIFLNQRCVSVHYLELNIACSHAQIVLQHIPSINDMRHAVLTVLLPQAAPVRAIEQEAKFTEPRDFTPRDLVRDLAHALA